MSRDYDAIVIGSGIGGLSCACFLALDGEKVLLVERDPILGGCMQPVGDKEENWQWNLGLQWICKFGKYDPDGLMMHHITEGRVEFNQLDEKFQDMVFPDHDDYKYTVIADMDKNEKALKKAFPDEAEKIDQYYGWVRDVNRKVLSLPISKLFSIKKAKRLYPKLLHLLFPFLPHQIGGPLTTTSVAEVVEDKLGIKDPILLDILYSYWHFLGMTPREIPFLFYAVAVGLQEGGVYYPKGGAESIIDAAEETIKNNNGTVLKSSEVDHIVVEDGKAVGVQLKDRKAPITAKNVISAIGIRETIERIIPDDAKNEQIETTYKAVTQELREVPSILLLRIGLAGDLSEFGVRQATYRSIKGTPWDMKSDPHTPEWSPPDVTINFPSFYDTGNIGPGHHTAEVVALTDYKYFKKYYNPDGTRSDEYYELVDKMKVAMLDKMNEFFPGITKKKEFMMLTTPLDVKDKTGHDRATIYGLDINKAANMDVQTHSGIDHLYYSGQDVFAQGITLTNGVLSAGAILGLSLVKQFF